MSLPLCGSEPFLSCEFFPPHYLQLQVPFQTCSLVSSWPHRVRCFAALELSPPLCGCQGLLCAVRGAELEFKGVDEGFAYVGNVVF